MKQQRQIRVRDYRAEGFAGRMQRLVRETKGKAG